MSEPTRAIEVHGIACEHCEHRLRDVIADTPWLRLEGVSPPHATVGFISDVESADAERERVARQILEAAGFNTRPAETQPSARPGLALLALTVLAASLIGYGAYALYPRFDLPAAEGVALLLLAVAAGFASFFSPCAFSLLLALLGREEPEQPNRPVPPLRFAAAMSFGAFVFVLAVGAAVALGAQSLVAGVTFTSTPGRLLRLVAGAALILMGLHLIDRLHMPLAGVARLRAPLARAQHRQRLRHPTLSYGIFGFSHLLAGFG